MTATTRMSKTRQKARTGQKVCIRCNRVLKPEVKHTETVLGIVGPECEQYVMNALNHLSRNGLRELAQTGEIRLAAVRTGEETWGIPQQEYAELQVLAARVGIRFAVKFDVAEKQIVITLHASSIRELLSQARQTKGVLA